MHSRYLFPLLVILLSQISTLIAGQLPEKHPLDESESRTIVLENGLKVLLVSDPELNMSAASMAVAVGSLLDPPEVQGLAHFPCFSVVTNSPRQTPQVAIQQSR